MNESPEQLLQLRIASLILKNSPNVTFPATSQRAPPRAEKSKANSHPQDPEAGEEGGWGPGSVPFSRELYRILHSPWGLCTSHGALNDSPGFGSGLQ